MLVACFSATGNTQGIVPFCTSGSSATNLHALAPNANWLSGQRFSGSTSESAVTSWAEGLDLLSGMDGEFEVSVSIVE